MHLYFHWNQFWRGNALEEESRTRPATKGGEREGLLLGQGIGQLIEEIENVGAAGLGRDPVGGAGAEGEPIGSGAAGDDVVDDVFEFPDRQHLDVTGRIARGGGGIEIKLELNELSLGAVGGQEPACDCAN